MHILSSLIFHLYVYVFVFPDVKLELSYLSERLSCCKAGWFHLGVGLGLKEPQLQKFESERLNGRVEMCLLDVLTLWLNSENAGVDVLVKALRTIGHGFLADKIKTKYSGEL